MFCCDYASAWHNNRDLQGMVTPGQLCRKQQGEVFLLRMRAFWGLLFLWVAGVYLVPQHEKDTLVEFYNATSGSAAWTNKWNLSTDPCSPPTWYGIACGYSASIGTYIQGIYLEFNNLQGSLTNLNLTNLTYL